MVDCTRFLEEYSDYRDGLLSPARHQEVLAHLGACPACAHYDRVVGEGARVFRELPQLQPSCDLTARLQHRLYHLEDDAAITGRRASGAPVALTVLIAAGIAAIAWVPVVRPKPAVVELPPVMAHAPRRWDAVPTLFRAGPLLMPAQATQAPASPPATTLLFQYSPLGTPPVHSASVVQPR